MSLNDQKVCSKYKILIIGDSQTGKTSFFNRCLNQSYSETVQPTLGVDFCLQNIELNDGNKIKIQFWEFAGNYRYQQIVQRTIMEFLYCLIQLMKIHFKM